MKIFWRSLILLALTTMACLTGHAQQKLQMKLGYNFNTPIGSSFKDLISNTSFRGFNGELSYSLNDQLLIGLGISYNDFYQKYPRQVVATKYGDISAVVSNSVQTTPALAKVTYIFSDDGLLRPYAGLGAGINFIQYSQYLGQYNDSKSALKPAVQADAGVNIILSKLRGSGVSVGADYNYMPFNYGEVRNLNNWGVHAGVFFVLR